MSAVELDLEQPAATHRLRPEPIEPRVEAHRIAKRYGLSLRQLLSERRNPLYCEARRQLYLVLRAAGWSYPMIGEFVGRDHTTVLNALGLKHRPIRKCPVRKCPVCGARAKRGTERARARRR